MAKKISELPEQTTLNDTDLILVQDNQKGVAENMPAKDIAIGTVKDKAVDTSKILLNTIDWQAPTGDNWIVDSVDYLSLGGSGWGYMTGDTPEKMFLTVSVLTLVGTAGHANYITIGYRVAGGNITEVTPVAYTNDIRWVRHTITSWISLEANTDYEFLLRMRISNSASTAQCSRSVSHHTPRFVGYVIRG